MRPTTVAHVLLSSTQGKGGRACGLTCCMAISFGSAGFDFSALARSGTSRVLLSERLATGRRIVRGADDPAALAIGAQLEFEARALRVDRLNIAQGQAALRIADGGLAAQQELLGRAGEIAMQAASSLLTGEQRGVLAAELRSIVDEIDRVAATTTFNGQSLIGGTTPAEISVRVGPDGGATSDVAIEIAPSTGASLGGRDPGTGTTLTLHELDPSSVAGARGTLAVVAHAIDQIAGNRAALGASFLRLETADRVGAARILGTEAARSRLLDLDVPRATTDLVMARARERVGIAMLGQLHRERGRVLDLLI